MGLRIITGLSMCMKKVEMGKKHRSLLLTRSVPGLTHTHMHIHTVLVHLGFYLI